MSLLLRPPHKVLVLPRTNERNHRGVKDWRVSGAPVLVKCAVQPVREWSTSEEQFSAGIQMLDLRRLFSRHWPGDINAHVIHDGIAFETVGAPQNQRMSRRTSHWAITMRWIGAPKREELEQAAAFLGIAFLPPPAEPVPGEPEVDEPAPSTTDEELLALIWTAMEV